MTTILHTVCKRLLKLLARHMPSYRIRVLFLSLAGYRIGASVFIGEELIIKDELADRGMVTIGDRVAIADRVTLVVSSNANFSRIRNQVGDVHSPVHIEDDAWLGTGCIILPGVRIGRGAVVGAGSVVTRSVPDYVVVAGNPARFLRNVLRPDKAADVKDETKGPFGTQQRHYEMEGIL